MIDLTNLKGHLLTDMLVLAQRVKNAIELGEGHFREFKSAYDQIPGAQAPRKVPDICRDIARTLVAFANADGGDLLIGVEDDGTITGVPHEGAQLDLLMKSPTTHIMDGEHLSLQHASSLTLDGKRVLLFSVTKGTGRIFQTVDGRTVKRDGLRSVPVQAEALLFKERERESRVHDTEFVDGAEVNHLDIDLLRGIAQQYLQGLTPELYLQQMGLAEYAAGGLRLRRAALLLFAHEIPTWHPRCQVRILRVLGTELKQGVEYNVSSQEVVTGNIFKLQLTAWEALRPFLTQSTFLGEDARFQQRYLYPELACREALINAITHRDYTMNNGIDVFVFDDRMEIRSPGALLSTLSVDDLRQLRGVHESRNSLVARALREAGFVQELGEGMRRMFTLMEESALKPPDLGSESTSFSVTLFHRSVFSAQQENWLRLFDAWNLGPLQQKIVVAGMHGNELSPDDIYTAINSHDRDAYDREVTILRRNGLLLETKRADEATALAKRNKVAKSSVGRFVVANPLVTPPEGRVVANRMRRGTSKEALAAAFAIHGEVVYSQVMSRADRPSRGIVIYTDTKVANAVLSGEKVVVLDGERISVSRPAQFIADVKDGLAQPDQRSGDRSRRQSHH